MLVPGYYVRGPPFNGAFKIAVIRKITFDSHYLDVGFYNDCPTANELKEFGDLPFRQIVTLLDPWVVNDALQLVENRRGYDQVKALLLPQPQNLGRRAVKGNDSAVRIVKSDWILDS